MLSAVSVLLLLTWTVSAQSSDLSFPTAITENQIAGHLKARDIGDARLTTYYFTFNGTQGDLFINVVTKNLSGSIDVFTVDAMRPLTKILVYADLGTSETGRVIYLRKPERLMLRVQGRSPGDEEATVRIKFAGSFAASKLEESRAPDVPRVESAADSNIRVNSVGTILAVIPKAKPSPESVTAETAEAEKKSVETDSEKSVVDSTAKTDVKESKEKEEEPRKVEVIVSDSTVGAKKEEVPEIQPPVKSSAENEVVGTKITDAEPKPRVKRQPRVSAAKREEVIPKVDPMAGIRLVVYFKDGSSIDRPMTEVMRFSVEKAILTVISKNGSIGRYNMTEVARVSIE